MARHKELEVPQVLTTNAVIMCPHGGKVQLARGAASVKISGGMAVCVGDLVGAPIAGCVFPPTPAGNKPCTFVISAVGQSARVTAGRRPVHLLTLSGMTDGVPPVPIQVLSAGQLKVNASP